MADSQAQAMNTPKSAKTVTVACKMPNGMMLQLQQEYTDTEQTMNGTRDVKRHRKVGETVVVAGNAIHVGVPDAPRKQIVGGYALTRGVDADFWAKWFEQNKDAPYVKEGIIFAMPNRDAVEDKAEEQVSITSGLEPLNPAHTVDKKGNIVPADARFPRSVGGVSAIHTGEKAA